ncbi:MAG: transglutaminase domain-containing protein [Acidobacteriota bacterium]
MNWIAITIDYETWHPVPPGKVINWEETVFSPARQLLDVCEGAGAKLTFMAEMAEYFWLRKNAPDTARRMEDQWRETIGRGHDVQLHLHPNWLPEMGASCKGGVWHWDWSKAKANDYPGDLPALIARARSALEDLLQPERSGYIVNSFRAGSYQVQPFKRLHDALVHNGIFCDSSVYAGGVSIERGYDFSNGCSAHQPYYASAYDPQLEAPMGEQTILEMPIFTYEPGSRWFLDNDEGAHIAERLTRFLKRTSTGSRQGRWVGRSDQYFVIIGHTKATLKLREIAKNLARLRDEGFCFETLSVLAERARRQLSVSRQEETTLNTGKSKELMCSAGWKTPGWLPWDRSTVVCGPHVEAGGELAREYPWLVIRQWEQNRTSTLDDTQAGLKGTGSTDSPSMDCLFAGCAVAHLPNPDRFLAEAFEALSDGGVLVGTVPSVPKTSVPVNGGVWHSSAEEIRLRLASAGFVNVEALECQQSACRSSPAPAICFRAWKRARPVTKLERALEAMDWVYHKLNPERPSSSDDPAEILKGGYAYCWGYAVVLGKLLANEGYRVRWVSMIARGHPRGIGLHQRESHEVLTVELEQKSVILDPMANTCIPHGIAEVLANPQLAQPKTNPDDRYRARGYHLYDTGEWYRRVWKYAVRSEVNQRVFFWKRNPSRPGND